MMPILIRSLCFGDLVKIKHFIKLILLIGGEINNNSGKILVISKIR